jgi:hypothetical protein
MDQPDFDAFTPGQVLESESGERVVVLVVDSTGENALLGPLVSVTPWPVDPTKIRVTKPFWATLAKVHGWKPAYFNGPRLIQAFDRKTQKKLWEAYAPDFNAALNLADELESDDKRLIDLFIVTQHDDEVAMLDDHGHFKPVPDPPPMEIADAEFFESLTGSMTSKDGAVLYLQARRLSGEEHWIAFPHDQVSSIVEAVAIQLGGGRDPDGKGFKDAFIASGFSLGRGPAGEIVLTLWVGDSGKLSFLLTTKFAEELAKSLTL